MVLGQSIKAKDLKTLNSIMSGSRKRTEAPLKLKRKRSELSYNAMRCKKIPIISLSFT